MRRSKVAIWSSLLLAAPLVLSGCGSSSNDLPKVERVEQQFVGADRCSFCHPKAHNEWKDSWHTKKSTYGPNWPGKAAEGKAKFLPEVIAMWEAGDMKSHMILDRAAVTEDDKKDGITNKNYITVKQYNWDDVDIIVGETRKQRYAVYYDGEAVEEVIYLVSKDGGISWSIPEGQTPFKWDGNKERAGYKFLTIEMDALKKPTDAGYQKGGMYGEFWSWQERCIGCHTTGFDVDAWNEAKSDFVSGNRDDLRDIFVSDVRISCEACHGDGGRHAESRLAADIINPAKLKGDDRMLACNQCHTRTSGNLLHTGAPNDNRGLVLGQDSYLDVMSYVRPAWGKGSRAVSIDGKGRRDHQQDMDVLLTKYINDELKRGNPNNPHGDMACFECHNAHGVGNVGNYSVSHPDKSLFTTGKDADGTIRLTDTREAVCLQCHRAEEVDGLLAVMNGRTGFGTADGFKATGYGNWDTPFGRQDRKQHIFSTDGEGRSWGLYPEEYIWALPIGTADTVEKNFKPIWPWEKDLFKKNNHDIFYGPAPWKGEEGRTDGQLASPVQTAFAQQFTGPGACAECHKAAHNEWKTSWHTLKATYGPAFEPGGEGEKAGYRNINPWVQENWDSLLSHMILDQVGSDPEGGLAPVRAANPGITFNNSDLLLTEKTFKLNEVAIVVGQTRKQRYAVYYDGSPVDRAYVARTTNGGIRYDILKDGNDDPIVVEYPGNLDRAGYNFLFIEMELTRDEDPSPKANNYGEYRSWQERCIGCHTTGFDADAWRAAKDDFMGAQNKYTDLKEIFVADIRISCESCHGPGAEHVEARRAGAVWINGEIINPQDLEGAQRQAVCGQCHTRTQGNLKKAEHPVANDNRGFVLGGDKELMDVFEYTRPAWGKGNRQVSIDGKGRRDHQQDMDIMLTDHIRGGNSYHGSQACFDCHTSHGVGSKAAIAPATVKVNAKGEEYQYSNPHLTTAADIDGTIRLKDTRDQLCAGCHNVDRVLGIMNGRTGFDFGSNSNKGEDWYGWLHTDEKGTWDTAAGRGDRKQHIFATDREGRSFGLFPEEYIWAKTDASRVPTAMEGWEPIWPWEIERYEAKGVEVYTGADPLNQ